MREPFRVERAILARLLSVDFEGVNPLHNQVQAILGVEPNCTCGCPSTTPHIDRTAAPPSDSGSPLPVELAELIREDGGSANGPMLLGRWLHLESGVRVLRRRAARVAFCATTFTCYRESFAADGSALTRVFVK